jgi:hypothetical protein
VVPELRRYDHVETGQGVVMGWVLGGEGRKHVAAAAILGEDGTPRALARATRIATTSP